MNTEFPEIFNCLLDGLGKGSEFHSTKIGEGPTGIEEDGRRIIWTEVFDLRRRIGLDFHGSYDVVVELFDGDICPTLEVVGITTGTIKRLQHDPG